MSRSNERATGNALWGAVLMTICGAVWVVQNAVSIATGIAWAIGVIVVATISVWAASELWWRFAQNRRGVTPAVAALAVLSCVPFFIAGAIAVGMNTTKWHGVGVFVGAMLAGTATGMFVLRAIVRLEAEMDR